MNTFEKKKVIITDIMQACAANDVPSMDLVFMNLLTLDIPGLKKVAHELYIKTT